MRHPSYVRSFADALRVVRTKQPLVALGELSIPARRTAIEALQYNKKSWELLRGAHDYVLSVGGERLELSAQLYLNTLNHYRLFAYARSGKTSGMLFSVNLTTSRDVAGVVGLSQRIHFAEGRGTDRSAAQAIRRAKARMLADILTRSRIVVTDNLEIDLGTFSSRRRGFLDTTAAGFISQFFTVAVLKGHFQGNKGYQLACLPRVDDSFPWKWNSAEAVREKLAPNRRGRRGFRPIGLSLRYQVLERDGSRCCVCGRGPHEGVTLHVDHIRPYSLGGLTVLSNLQLMCADCNLGKGNRSATDHRKNAG